MIYFNVKNQTDYQFGANIFTYTMEVTYTFHHIMRQIYICFVTSTSKVFSKYKAHRNIKIQL